MYALFTEVNAEEAHKEAGREMLNRIAVPGRQGRRRQGRLLARAEERAGRVDRGLRDGSRSAGGRRPVRGRRNRRTRARPRGSRSGPSKCARSSPRSDQPAVRGLHFVTPSRRSNASPALSTTATPGTPHHSEACSPVRTRMACMPTARAPADVLAGTVAHEHRIAGVDAELLERGEERQWVGLAVLTAELVAVDLDVEHPVETERAHLGALAGGMPVGDETELEPLAERLQPVDHAGIRVELLGCVLVEHVDERCARHVGTTDARRPRGR